MKEFVSEFDKNINPIKYIKLMYNNTDEKGVLYIPGWYYLNEKEHSLRCRISWNENTPESIINEYNDLLNKIKKIAEIYKEAGDDVSHIKELLTDSELYPVWSTYFRPFTYKKASSYRIQDIADKIDTVKQVKILEHKMWSDKDIDAYERKLYQDYKDLQITKEESEIYKDYCRAFYDDCEKRVGNNIGAADQILRARRLCKLLEIGAPKIIINNEACMLAAALVIHKNAKSMDKVSDEIRLNTERLSCMSEEEEEAYLDSLYRPKKKNNRKHNLNLFLYIILKTKSNVEKHLSQSEILRILHEEFELDVERKALSRAIHDIEDEQIGVLSNPRGGTWYDGSLNEHENVGILD